MGEREDDDIIEVIDDIFFYFKPALVNEFGNIAILSTRENKGRYMVIKPLSLVSGP